MEARILDDLNQKVIGFTPEPAVPAAADPGEYRLPIRHDTDPESEQYIAFDGMARGWLTAMELDSQTGSSLADLAESQARHWASKAPAERQAAPDEAIRVLREVWGPDFETNAALVRQYVQYVEDRSPGIVDYLYATGLDSDPVLLNQLVEIARRGTRR